MKRSVIRSISGTLLAAFLFQDLVSANPQSFHQAAFASVKPPKLEIPSSVAVIEDSWVAPQSDKMIFLIQDAHTNESAQKNIAKTVECILGKIKPSAFVFLEGGTGNASLSHLRQFGSTEQRRQVADKYLRKGVVQGPDYLDLTSDKVFTLWGVENDALYVKALAAYRHVKAKRAAVENYLDKIQRTLRTLKPKIYNPALYLLDEKRSSFGAHAALPLTEYIDVLLRERKKLNIPQELFPNLLKLGTIKALEREIDFEKASREQLRAVESLSQGDQLLLKDVLKNRDHKTLFLLDSTEHREEKGFYALLEEKLAAGSLKPADYPNLQSYFNYLKYAKKLDLKILFREKDDLETIIYNSLAQSEDERVLIQIDQNLALLRKLLNLTLISEDLRRIKSHPGKFDLVSMTGFLNKKIMELGEYYEEAIFLEPAYEECHRKALEFYALAEERDGEFLKNLSQKMDEQKQDASILVTGGFHTDHLKSLLRQNRISYVSLTPQVLRETNMKKYEGVLLAEQEKGMGQPGRRKYEAGHIGVRPARYQPLFEAALVPEVVALGSRAARTEKPSTAEGFKGVALFAVTAILFSMSTWGFRATVDGIKPTASQAARKIHLERATPGLVYHSEHTLYPAPSTDSANSYILHFILDPARPAQTVFKPGYSYRFVFRFPEFYKKGLKSTTANIRGELFVNGKRKLDISSGVLPNPDNPQEGIYTPFSGVRFFNEGIPPNGGPDQLTFIFNLDAAPIRWTPGIKVEIYEVPSDSDLKIAGTRLATQVEESWQFSEAEDGASIAFMDVPVANESVDDALTVLMSHPYMRVGNGPESLKLFFRRFILEMRGHGQSALGEVGEANYIQRVVKDFLAIIEEKILKDAKAKLALVGHSLAGLVMSQLYMEDGIAERTPLLLMSAAPLSGSSIRSTWKIKVGYVFFKAMEWTGILYLIWISPKPVKAVCITFFMKNVFGIPDAEKFKERKLPSIMKTDYRMIAKAFKSMLAIPWDPQKFAGAILRGVKAGQEPRIIFILPEKDDLIDIGHIETQVMELKKITREMLLKEIDQAQNQTSLSLIQKYLWELDSKIKLRLVDDADHALYDSMPKLMAEIVGHNLRVASQIPSGRFEARSLFQKALLALRPVIFSNRRIALAASLIWIRIFFASWWRQHAQPLRRLMFLSFSARLRIDDSFHQLLLGLSERALTGEKFRVTLLKIAESISDEESVVLSSHIRPSEIGQFYMPEPSVFSQNGHGPGLVVYRSGKERRITLVGRRAGIINGLFNGEPNKLRDLIESQPDISEAIVRAIGQGGIQSNAALSRIESLSLEALRAQAPRGILIRLIGENGNLGSVSFLLQHLANEIETAQGNGAPNLRALEDFYKILRIAQGLPSAASVSPAGARLAVASSPSLNETQPQMGPHGSYFRDKPLDKIFESPEELARDALEDMVAHAKAAFLEGDLYIETLPGGETYAPFRALFKEYWMKLTPEEAGNVRLFLIDELGPGTGSPGANQKMLLEAFEGIPENMTPKFEKLYQGDIADITPAEFRKLVKIYAAKLLRELQKRKTNKEGTSNNRSAIGQDNRLDSLIPGSKLIHNKTRKGYFVVQQKGQYRMALTPYTRWHSDRNPVLISTFYKRMPLARLRSNDTNGDLKRSKFVMGRTPGKLLLAPENESQLYFAADRKALEWETELIALADGTQAEIFVRRGTDPNGPQVFCVHGYTGVGTWEMQQIYYPKEYTVIVIPRYSKMDKINTSSGEGFFEYHAEKLAATIQHFDRLSPSSKKYIDSHSSGHLVVRTFASQEKRYGHLIAKISDWTSSDSFSIEDRTRAIISIIDFLFEKIDPANLNLSLKASVLFYAVKYGLTARFPWPVQVALEPYRQMLIADVMIPGAVALLNQLSAGSIQRMEEEFQKIVDNKLSDFFVRLKIPAEFHEAMRLEYKKMLLQHVILEGHAILWYYSQKMDQEADRVMRKYGWNHLFWTNTADGLVRNKTVKRIAKRFGKKAWIFELVADEDADVMLSHLSHMVLAQMWTAVTVDFHRKRRYFGDSRKISIPVQDAPNFLADRAPYARKKPVAPDRVTRKPRAGRLRLVYSKTNSKAGARAAERRIREILFDFSIDFVAVPFAYIVVNILYFFPKKWFERQKKEFYRALHENKKVSGARAAKLKKYNHPIPARAKRLFKEMAPPTIIYRNLQDYDGGYTRMRDWRPSRILEELISRRRPVHWVDIGPGYGIALRAGKRLYLDALDTVGIDRFDWFENGVEGRNFDDDMETIKESNPSDILDGKYRYQLMQTDVTRARFPHMADLVTAVYVLQYLNDPLAAVVNWYNQLTLNGYLLLTADLLLPSTKDREKNNAGYYLKKLADYLLTLGNLVESTMTDLTEKSFIDVLAVQKRGPGDIRLNLRASSKGSEFGRRVVKYKKIDSTKPEFSVLSKARPTKVKTGLPGARAATGNRPTFGTRSAVELSRLDAWLVSQAKKFGNLFEKTMAPFFFKGTASPAGKAGRQEVSELSGSVRVPPKYGPSSVDNWLFRLNPHLPGGIRAWRFEEGMLFKSEEAWWKKSQRRNRSHEGVDFRGYVGADGSLRFVESGTPVVAIVPGTVVTIFNDWVGQTVVIKTDGGDFFLYSHVTPRKGTVIGSFIGSTRAFAHVGAKGTTPPHLHVSVLRVDTALAPDFDEQKITYKNLYVLPPGVEWVDPLRYGTGARLAAGHDRELINKASDAITQSNLFLYFLIKERKEPLDIVKRKGGSSPIDQFLEILRDAERATALRHRYENSEIFVPIAEISSERLDMLDQAADKTAIRRELGRYFRQMHAWIVSLSSERDFFIMVHFRLWELRVAELLKPPVISASSPVLPSDSKEFIFSVVRVKSLKAGFDGRIAIGEQVYHLVYAEGGYLKIRVGNRVEEFRDFKFRVDSDKKTGRMTVSSGQMKTLQDFQQKRALEKKAVNDCIGDKAAELSSEPAVIDWFLDGYAQDELSVAYLAEELMAFQRRKKNTQIVLRENTGLTEAVLEEIRDTHPEVLKFIHATDPGIETQNRIAIVSPRTDLSTFNEGDKLIFMGSTMSPNGFHNVGPLLDFADFGAKISFELANPLFRDYYLEGYEALLDGLSIEDPEEFLSLITCRTRQRNHSLWITPHKLPVGSYVQGARLAIKWARSSA